MQVGSQLYCSSCRSAGYKPIPVGGPSVCHHHAVDQAMILACFLAICDSENSIHLWVSALPGLVGQGILKIFRVVLAPMGIPEFVKFLDDFWTSLVVVNLEFVRIRCRSTRSRIRWRLSWKKLSVSSYLPNKILYLLRLFLLTTLKYFAIGSIALTAWSFVYLTSSPGAVKSGQHSDKHDHLVHTYARR